jgi:hypothetical protein
MQGRRNISKIFLVALIVSLILGGCGGGSTGSTWFNLPSIPLQIQADGSASVLGFNVGAILQPTMVQSLQGANIQKLEVRIGYNGIHVYANGQDMPYLAWDESSVGSLQEIIRTMPNIPNANLIANALPWLRRIGVGVTLSLPPAQGQAVLDIPHWKGETTAKTEAKPDKPTIGPLSLGSLAFDPSGNATIAGIPLSQLGVAVALPANVQDILKALSAEKLAIKTTPNGIQLSLNDKSLPGIAYDSNSLQQVTQLLPALGVDANTLSTLQNVLPQLPGAEVSVDVSLTGQPASPTQIGSIPLTLNPDGTLSAYGLPLGGSPLLPANIIASLQQANVQHLYVNVEGNSIILAANGQVLPILSYDDASLDSLTQLAGAFGVPQETVSTGLQVVRKLVAETSIGMTIDVPAANGAAAIEAPTGPPDTTMDPANLNGLAPPVIHLNATFDQQGVLKAVDTLTTDELGQLGIPLAFTLPANIANALDQLGAQQVSLKSEPNKLNLQLDGKTALSLSYDEVALRQTLSLAKPFLAGTLLEDPTIAQLIDQQILPVAPAADLDIDVKLQ